MNAGPTRENAATDLAPPRSPLALVLGVAVVALVAALAVRSITPPPARPLDAPATEFSATRALAHVRAISASPHPVGSPAHAAVRAYLLETLRALALETRVQESSCAVRAAGMTHAAVTHNVLARLPGSRGAGPAILLAAHYDSVPQSRGASDDGSGVATLLETARALVAGPRLQNDVVFLFTDAEEMTACGAIAFTGEELARQPVGVALNFEARGTGGAVAMYDTSAGDGALIEALAATASRPVSTSLLGALARTLPNDSDATVFKRAGIPTYAFAYVDRLYQYHQYTDAADALDVRSLQHDGDYALPLVRYWGDRDIPVPAKPDVAYFDVFCAGIVSYSTLAARLLAAVTLVAFVALVRRERRAGRVTFRGIGAGAGLAVGAIVSATLAGAVPGLVLAKVVDPFLLFARPTLGAVATLGAGVAAFVLVYLRSIRRGAMANAAFGAMALWAVKLVALAVFAPAASFAFQWPLLFAVAGAAFWTGRGDGPPWRVDLAVTASLIPAALFWGYLAYSLFTMVGASVIALVVATALLLALPLLARLRALEARWAAAAAASVALVAMIAAVFVVGGARDIPHRDSLAYVAYPDRAEALWTTEDRSPGAYAAQRIPAGRTSAPASMFAFIRPGARMQSVDEGGLRRLTVDVDMLPGARCLQLSQSSGNAIVETRVDGKPVTPLVRFSPELDEKLFKLVTGDRSPSRWSLEHCGARGAVHLDLVARAGVAPVTLTVTEIIDGLPGPPLAARGPGVYPAQDSDTTFVSFDLGL